MNKSKKLAFFVPHFLNDEQEHSLKTEGHGKSLYLLSEPFEGHYWIVVSKSHIPEIDVFDARENWKALNPGLEVKETAVFPANHLGEIISWQDLQLVQNILSDYIVLNNMGYEVVSFEEQKKEN